MREAQQTAGMIRRPLLPILLVLLLSPRGAAQGRDPAGERAVAEQYLRWAQGAVTEGRWGEALAALERAADWGDLSSDLSYLLARARFHEGKPRKAVLEALRRGLEADRWRAYSAADARLLEAEVLIALRAFSEALGALSRVPPGIEAACLRLRALRGMADIGGFRQSLREALERYPRSPGPVRLLFETLQGEPSDPSLGETWPARPIPSGPDRDLLDTALRRLPLLLEEDGELAFLAAPFIADIAEARRLVAAYRVAEEPRAASLPTALALGLIGEGQALEELFPPRFPLSVDRALLRSVWALLRTEESRRQFNRNLLSFSGVITEDTDRDAYIESAALYAHGELERYTLDGDQDGLAELTVYFSGGVPQRAEALTWAEAGEEAQPTAFIRWEQYPGVDSVRLGEMSFSFRPREFFYAPLGLVEGPGGVLLYPEREGRTTRISRRSLFALALLVERPGRDFEGAVEQVEMDRGIARRAVELLEGRLVSETEFIRGMPSVQRIDLDLDGRLETVRYFHRDMVPQDTIPGEAYLRGARTPERAESDWDGDGIFETGEEYFPDGSVRRSWDMDKDGIKEYIEVYAKD